MRSESFWANVTARQALEYDTKAFVDPVLGIRVAASSTEIRDLATFVESAPELVSIVCGYMVQRDLHLLRLSGASKDSGIMFVVRQADWRFDMDGLAEDFSRKKLRKKGYVRESRLRCIRCFDCE
eukprot:COSAG01_NODE_4792_length_4740_cov_8.902392_4_plen_125_part_00